jgi:tetratricopeptide (TPR) repeat protein
LLLLQACAARGPERVTPRTDLGDPLLGTELAPSPEYAKAYKTYLSGDQKRARSRFLKITEESPNYYPAYLGIAYTYLAEDRSEFAESYIGRALEVNPDYAQAHFVLANILEVRQNYAAAMDQLKEVERINPNFPNLEQARNVLLLKATEQYLNMGRELAEKNPQEALKYLKAAHDMAPEVPQIPVDIANILVKQNNCREAVSYLKIAVEKNPDDFDVKQKLGACLLQLEEYTQAQAVYEQLAFQAPQNVEVQERLEEINRQIFIQNLPSDYQVIPHTSEITRSQFAAYLVIQLEALQKYGGGNQQIIVDIIHHWAQNYIQKVVNLGIMDVFPNRTFQPDQPITKLELAKAASRIMEIIELSGHGKFPADPSLNIPDVPAGHMNYRLVAKPVSARVISLDADGRFHPSRRVSGTEAISVVNQLKSFLETV